ncbi:uncharacterized protein LOC125677156 [Ostrea edulis]|uniref:uncharacterized protein LOC125677156 n=1 Tax=Ostrea edulis TaxID=37623 RepID=UPI0020942AFD|nr:uncharacterized protein LOC125677156 [Ostrea edulis]
MGSLKYFTKSREREWNVRRTINACKKSSSLSFTLNFITLQMEDVHREILRRNHSMLVKEMSPELIADKLYSDCILTLEMKEVVLAQLTRFAKTKKILEYLPKRGKKAFHSFCRALEETGQSELASPLRQDDFSNAREPTNNPTSSNPANNKKTSKKYTQLCQLHLGGEIYVTGSLCEIDNVVQIHIRQYGWENQKLFPTKKGVTLSLTEWLALEGFLNGMEEALKKYFERDFEEMWYLGSNIYITASKEFPLEDLRHYWKPDPNGYFVPTTRGVKLNRAKLQNLKDMTSIIRNYIPVLPAGIDLQSLEGLLSIPDVNC